MNYANFVVLSTQRSGSTLLRTALDSHPEISCRGELFLPSHSQGDSFRDFVSEKKLSQISELFHRRRLVYSYLDRVYDDTLVGARGFKIMYGQMGYRPYRFPMVFDYIRDYGVRIIHLVRENTLDTCISRQFARTSKTYHAVEQYQPRPQTVNIPTLILEMKKVEREKIRWRSAVKGLPCLDQTYEDFINSRSESSRRILEFLGVESAIELVSPLKRLSGAHLNERVLNYEEMVQEVVRHGYGRFLEGL